MFQSFHPCPYTSKSAKNDKKPERKKVTRMVLSRGIYEYYTDVLDHQFNPFDSKQLVIGTSFGDVVIVEDVAKPYEPFQPEMVNRVKLPNSSPVVSMGWGASKSNIFIASKRTVYFLNTDKPQDLEHDPNFPARKLDSIVPEPVYKSLFSDVMDLAFIPKSENRICLGCDDGTTRLYDLSAGKSICEIRDHTGGIEVCKAGNDFIVTGGADGFVYLYDSSFRTHEPIGVFDNKSPVNNLAVSPNSIWLAITGRSSSECPSVYNIGTRQCVPSSLGNSGDTEKIYALTFDEYGSLFWGGPDGTIYRSEDLQSISAKMRTRYGKGEVRQVFSITTACVNNSIRVSAAGSTNGVLFSSNGNYWDAMIHV